MENNMPLQDDYKTEKILSKESENIAEAITGHIQEQGYAWGFCLFLVDYATGTIQYISDVEHDDAVGMIKMWVNRESQ
jgi:hypothetical protein